jgi:hypothetical protein
VTFSFSQRHINQVRGNAISSTAGFMPASCFDLTMVQFVYIFFEIADGNAFKGRKNVVNLKS